ncbi:helix-turn-helix domain-containing protein [Leucobacter chinensis]|uniref:helix-turn-helix domain-containing protein n=1 Tax=Leucobacter chinensis TaxID=2851010 RepID=UPI001C24A228|nr:helix-turn-helix transcriptional regulator [Leucobacter chinensis]
MNAMHLLSGGLGTPGQQTQYSSYYRAIAETAHAEQQSGAFTRHRLRDHVGEGTIETAELSSGLRITRYDVAYASDHTVAYDFDGDRFELEMCLEGGMRITEERAGHGDLGAYATSITPFCPTKGMLVQEAGQRYRAVSVTSNRAGLEAHLGGLGVDGFVALLAELESGVGTDLYLGRGTELRGLARVMGEIFDINPDSQARTLLMEAKVMTALAIVADAASQRIPEHGLDAYEVAALRRVPAILWRERFDLPQMSDVARHLSMSAKRLSAGFKKLYGVTPIEYHRNFCIERAADLLVRSDWTVERIGFEVGYSSASNFVYAFRQRTGRTPAEYRRSLG